MEKILYEFRGKNGQVIILKNNTICIGRKGWFGVIYQFLTRGKRKFQVTDISDIVLKEPNITRGYIKFKISENKNDSGKEESYSTSVVWLTRKEMVDGAKKAIKVIEKIKSKCAV